MTGNAVPNDDSRTPIRNPANASPATAIRPRPLRRWLHQRVGDLLAARERRLPRDRRFAVIISHMRSGSSLLLHVLMQHPECAGAGERNKIIGTSRDLDRLAADAYIALRRFGKRSRYFVDQINHDRFLDAPSILAHPQLLPIFLIRRPLPSIASMVDVLGRHYALDSTTAIAYYRQRLACLERLARSLPVGAALFLTYEGMTTQTESTLRALERFLAMPSPGLQNRYPTHRFTGRAGDPSKRIQRGRIDPGPARPGTLEPATLDTLEADYARVSDLLDARCQTLALG